MIASLTPCAVGTASCHSPQKLKRRHAVAQTILQRAAVCTGSLQLRMLKKQTALREEGVSDTLYLQHYPQVSHLETNVFPLM